MSIKHACQKLSVVFYNTSGNLFIKRHCLFSLTVLEVLAHYWLFSLLMGQKRGQ